MIMTLAVCFASMVITTALGYTTTEAILSGILSALLMGQLKEAK